jgi:hypothetical protein
MIMNDTNHPLAITAALCLTVCAALAHADRVESRQLGIALNPPVGWAVQDNGTALLLAEPGVAGLYVVSTHAHGSVDAMMDDPASTRVVDGATALDRNGDFERTADDHLAAHYRGLLEGQPVRAYAVSRIEPAGGGASVLAIAPEAAWTASQEERARNLLRGIEFSQAHSTAGASAGSASNPFSGRRLVSIETSDTAYDGSGSRSRETADFCQDGRFFLYEESSLSANVAGGSAAQRAASTLVARWTAEQRGERHHVTLTNEDSNATLVITPIIDRYGDRAFQIDDRLYYYSGTPDC